MAIKDILVHVDATKACRSRVKAAAGLAGRHGARLIGLYVLEYPRIPAYVEAQISADILEQQAKAFREAAAEAEKVFAAETRGADIETEWRCVEGDTVESVALHGRYCDLVVVGQDNPDESATGAPGDMPDGLILAIGRPVLVIPYVGDYPVIGDRVMIAWDGSRTATRAVGDAMAFLKTAKEVSVTAVNPRRGAEGHGDLPGADITRHLARHGINAKAEHLRADDMKVDEILLSAAADRGTDLFVMGAYGHARLRELVLGGVTKHMLEHMTMPVLMSH